MVILNNAAAPSSANETGGDAFCPALLLSAPASGTGKTSIVAALARYHVRAGRTVRVFKCGPDFLDPQIHQAITGAPCENLDLWLCGGADGARRLARAAGEADLILVEGVMGLFDGLPSTADIACAFNLPVLAVIDASAMAQTFAAIAHGLFSFRAELPFFGVMANRVGSIGHGALIRDSLPERLHWCGSIPRDADAALPERHLGLLPAAEIPNLLVRVDRLADRIAETSLVHLPPAVHFAVTPPITCDPSRSLAGCRIAIARDSAFCFIYPANLDLLHDLDAEPVFFSPLADDLLPPCDAVWLPGGYPELYGQVLAQRGSLWRQLAEHVAVGKPLLAECGGMMPLFERLIDRAGNTYPMAGLLPGETVMGEGLAALGGQEAILPEGRLRGHTFHYSRCRTDVPPLTVATGADGRRGESIWRRHRLTASYLHFYFPSNPEAVAALFRP